MSRLPLHAALSVALCMTAVSGEDHGDDEPRRTDLVETAERRLVQIDVTVTGKAEALAELEADDFRLSIGTTRIEEFTVDDVCQLPDEPPTEQVEAGIEEQATTVSVRPRASFLFYFDQHHLTMAGRARAIDVAQDLIPELIINGNRGMIVSAGQHLRVFSELTDSPEQLLEALRTLNKDHTQWDPWVQEEQTRINEIIEILNDETLDVARALSYARGYAREERWRSQKALHVFSMVLGRISELDPPKAVIYFADTMRSNAGDHYLSFFSRRIEGKEGDPRGQLPFTAAHTFDRVVSDATAAGIRVFTVEARGLTSAPDSSVASETNAGFSSPVANSQPLRDAQNSMVAMAKESGGRSFLNGIRAHKIAAQVQQDLSCVYLLSFDASFLRENTSHRVVVAVDRKGVDLHARGQLTVYSESRKLTSRIMGAFVSPRGERDPLRVHGILIPTGFDNGKYTALVQLHVAGSPLAKAAWDLGLSLIARGEVAGDASGRITVHGPGVPVVLETEMKIRPGPFKLVGVAHETTADDLGSGEVESDWPDPDDAAVTLSPVAVLQPTSAAILRNNQLRREGVLGIAEDALARTDRPTALIGLVCRAKGNRGRWRVERKLEGEEGSFAPFGPMELDLGEDRCAQIRDFIPAGSLSSGMFSYEVRVFDKREEVASTVRRFAATDPDEATPATRPAGG